MKFSSGFSDSGKRCRTTLGVSMDSWEKYLKLPFTVSM